MARDRGKENEKRKMKIDGAHGKTAKEVPEGGFTEAKLMRQVAQESKGCRCNIL